MRLRRRHNYLLVSLLVLLSLSREKFLRRAPAAEKIETAADIYSWPSWKFSVDNFWGLIEPLFSSREQIAGRESPDVPVRRWAKFEPGDSPAAVAINEPPLVISRSDPAAQPIIFSYDQKNFNAPSREDFTDVNSPAIRTVSDTSTDSLVPPPVDVGANPPAIGQLPPSTLPEPGIPLIV